MKKINKLIAGVASAAMIVTAFSACGSASSSGKKLDFITGMATGSVHLKTLQSITDEFEKANPGVEINLIPASQDFTNDIKVRLAAKNAPDLWNTHGWSRDRYAKFLEPLQNRSWASKMKPITKEAFMEDDGTFYALPLDIQVTGVLYNKDVLDKVGVDPNELNTWDEFNDACQKVKDAGLTCVVAGGKDTAIAGDLADLTASSWYNDGELKKLQKGKFDSSVYQKESGLIEGWAKKGYFNPDYTSATQDDIEKLMANGQAAFYFRSNLHASQIQTFNSNVNLGFMATPTESGDRYVRLGGRCLQDRQEQGHRAEVHRFPRQASQHDQAHQDDQQRFRPQGRQREPWQDQRHLQLLGEREELQDGAVLRPHVPTGRHVGHLVQIH